MPRQPDPIKSAISQTLKTALNDEAYRHPDLKYSDVEVQELSSPNQFAIRLRPRVQHGNQLPRYFIIKVSEQL